MGLGTKIKEALQGDKDEHTTADTSKTPGSYPSEHTPRTTHAQGNTHGLNSPQEPRTEKLPGRHSPDYTHASTTGQTGHHGLGAAEGRHEHGLSGTTGTTGATATHGNKLSKSNKDPYWGDADRLGSGENVGYQTGTQGYGRSGVDPTGVGRQSGTHRYESSDLDPQDVNERYHATTGTTGTTSGVLEGTHGPHSSRTANAADPRFDSDRDHRGATTSGLRSSGGGAYAGTHGTTGTSGRDEYSYGGSSTTGHSSDRDALAGGATSGQGYGDRYDDIGTAQSGTTGTTSGLAHRPHDSAGLHRDQKINEYDTPSNSSDRGHGHGLAAAGTGAAAGYGASKFADSHHEHGHVRLSDPSTTGYTTSATHGASHGRDSGLIAPHSQQTAPTASGMLDPYDKTSSATGAVHGARDSTGANTSMRDSGLSHGDNASIGSSGYGSGRDRWGPGHDGARVMHKCHNCGADNDISKHFQKDSVYRLG